MFPRCHDCKSRRWYLRGKLGDVFIYQCAHCQALSLSLHEIGEVENPLIEMPFGALKLSKTDPHYVGDDYNEKAESEITVYQGQPKTGHPAPAGKGKGK